MNYAQFLLHSSFTYVLTKCLVFRIIEVFMWPCSNFGVGTMIKRFGLLSTLKTRLRL